MKQKFNFCGPAVFLFSLFLLFSSAGNAQEPVPVHPYGILSGEYPYEKVQGQEDALERESQEQRPETAEQEKDKTGQPGEAAGGESPKTTATDAKETEAAGKKPALAEIGGATGKKKQAAEIKTSLPEEEEDSAVEKKKIEDAATLMEPFERRGTPTGLEPVRVVAIITTDEYGHRISSPQTLWVDKNAKELFVIASGLGHSSIFVYDKNFYPTAVMGSGRGIIHPRGILVDTAGLIYVTWVDTASLTSNRSRLTIFNPAFFKIQEFDLTKIPETDNYDVQQIALDENSSTMYLAGSSTSLEKGGTKGVLVLDRQGNFKRWLVPIKHGKSFSVGDDPRDRHAMRVADIKVDDNDRLYILTPAEGKIFVLDADNNLLFTFGTPGGTEGKLSRPVSLAVDDKRQVIYVVDYMRHAVLLYNYDGTYLFEIGGFGSGPGWFNYPSYLAVDWDNNLVVADFYNNRVQVLDIP